MNHTLVTKRTRCPLCESSALRLVLPMKPSPIGDAFIPYDQKDIEQPLIPLDLYQCQQCGHAQNVDVVNPEVLFRDYIFTTASSHGLIKHFQLYAKEMVQKFNIPKGSLVIEIGSNDGTLLRFFKEFGLQVLGIDPAREIALKATASGVQTIPDFFTTTLAKKISQDYGKAKLVVANNVYAHSDELADITDAIAALLDDDGSFVFEVSYLLNIIDNFVFDTIYHEHLSYHSVAPLVLFFQRHGLELFDIQMISTKGGSMRCFVQKLKGPYTKSQIISQMIEEETRRGLHKPEIFKNYAMQIQQCKNKTEEYVAEALGKGLRIAGYGASNTVTTLMYQFELEHKLDYLIDDNTRKQSLLSPGCHLEVKPSSVLYENPPDIVIILAWQYANPIMQKHPRFIEQGGIFIIPLPEFKIISNDPALISKSAMKNGC